jgi:putative ABC transport system ATP-binding protein
MVTDSTLILADEPSANLDSATAASLLAVMEQLNPAHGTTFVFSIHDPQVMERARRLIHLRDGQVANVLKKDPVPRVPSESNAGIPRRL